jgi:hypothetical protein
MDDDLTEESSESSDPPVSEDEAAEDGADGISPTGEDDSLSTEDVTSSDLGGDEIPSHESTEVGEDTAGEGAL